MPCCPCAALTVHAVPSPAIEGTGYAILNTSSYPVLPAAALAPPHYPRPCYYHHHSHNLPCPTAQEARIGLADRIFTRLASWETAAMPQSTFMIDLSQVAGRAEHAEGFAVALLEEAVGGALGARCLHALVACR